MADLPLIGDHGVQAVLNWRNTSSGQTASVVFGLDASEAPVHTAGAIASSFADAWTGALEAPKLSNQVKLETCKVYYYPSGNDGSPTPVPQVGEVAINQTGVETATHCPPNCAVLVKKITESSGKSMHGKMYLPSGYITEGQVNDAGLIDTTLGPQLQSEIDQLQENLIDAAVGLVPVIMHHAPRVLGVLTGSPAGPMSPVVAMIVQSIIATQRRRLRR